MAIKYWQLNLKGAKSVEEIRSIVGPCSANLLRIHVEGGDTQVYFAGHESLQSRVVEATTAAGALKEIEGAEVTRF